MKNEKGSNTPNRDLDKQAYIARDTWTCLSVNLTLKHSPDLLYLALLSQNMQKKCQPEVVTARTEILHVNRFSSELVHWHIIYSLTLLLLLK